MRWTATLPHAGSSTAPSLSPDGTHLAYTAIAAGLAQIYVRATDQSEARAITGEDGINFSAHFFSPDGRWIAYGSLGSLKKVPTTGGTPITIADASFFNGGTW